MYIDKLNNIVNKYNNTYHRTIKIKPIYVKSSTYYYFDKENNKETPKFKVGDHVRKIFLQKAMFQIGLNNFFLIKKVKNTVSWIYVINELKGE